jgi:hypothetical protein
MSGDAAFDTIGIMIGVISSSFDEPPTFVSRSWPATYVPIAPTWPPAAMPAERSLCSLAKAVFGIERLEDVEIWWTEDGRQMVSISDPMGSA